jgi:hypothetical protein
MKATTISVVLLLILTNLTAQNDTPTQNTTITNQTSVNEITIIKGKDGKPHAFKDGIEIIYTPDQSFWLNVTPTTTIEPIKITTTTFSDDQIAQTEKLIMQYHRIQQTNLSDTVYPPSITPCLCLSLPILILIAAAIALLWRLGKPEVNEENE